MLRKGRRCAIRLRFAGTASAHKGAGGLPPIFRAWSISNAALGHNGIPFAAGFKTTRKIAIRTLRQTPFAVEKSPVPIRARILFGSIEGNWNPLIHVLLEPALLFEFRDKADGLIGRARPE